MKLNKKTLLFFLFLIVGIVLFINTLMSSGLESVFDALKNFSIINFTLFVILSGVNFYLYSLRWELILKALLNNDKKISGYACFLHRMAGFAISYITPSAQVGGEPMRIMLMEEDGVSRKIATSSVIIDKAFELAALIIFIVVGLIISLIDGNVPFGTKGIIWGVIVALLSLVFWFYYSSLKRIGFLSSLLRFFRLHKIKRLEKVERKIFEFEDEMNNFYHDHKKVLHKLVVISLLTTAFILVEHYIVAKFLGVNLTFIQIFLASTIPYLAYLIPVPGGLGVLESGHAAIFLLMGVSINAFVFVFIIRLRDLVFVIIGLAHASKRGLKMLRTEYKDELKK